MILKGKLRAGEEWWTKMEDGWCLYDVGMIVFKGAKVELTLQEHKPNLVATLRVVDALRPLGNAIPET